MRHVALLAAGLLSVLALAACGSSSGNTDSAAAAADARDTARLKLQACMRKQGIDIPSPKAGGGPQIRRITPAQARKAQAAIQGPCKQYAQAAFGNLTPQQRQEFQDRMARFSACMRQHGVDIPTFTPGQPPGQRRFRLNPNTPKFKAAMQACQSVAPGRPGGGGGGRGGIFIGPGPGG